ncbi:hypothetical protein [Nonomuraea pusilla]|uniref:Secreted protein n=1 Tax=Nonomuraea pusilla TaxID=46177 RepID=A0A1H7ZYY8_9ACTN|nr:hypothetical protein [Nonomuraea pusilla]SEM63670.1 hypothetical protein SAMN05660976_05694 [Nonomuraea pusilla]
MRAFRRTLTSSIAAVSASTLFTAAPPADATAASSPCGNGPWPGWHNPLINGLTDITEVANQTSHEVQVKDGENPDIHFTVPAGGKWTGSMWVPWVGRQNEMRKSITITWGNRTRYWMFQTFGGSDQGDIKCSATGGFEISGRVSSDAVEGGKKRLVIRDNDTLFLEWISGAP